LNLADDLYVDLEKRDNDNYDDGDNKVDDDDDRGEEDSYQ
jgi:hypothetical protein